MAAIGLVTGFTEEQYEEARRKLEGWQKEAERVNVMMAGAYWMFPEKAAYVMSGMLILRGAKGEYVTIDFGNGTNCKQNVTDTHTHIGKNNLGFPCGTVLCDVSRAGTGPQIPAAIISLVLEVK